MPHTERKLDIQSYIHADKETRRFETTMSERYGRQVALHQVPLKEFVDVSTGLFERKVAQLVIQGATDEAGYWRDICRVYPMQAEVESVPITSMRNYKVRTGRYSGALKEDSGGKVDSVTVDVRNADKERYIYLQVNGRDIELKKFASIEQSLIDSGRAFAKQIRDDVLAKMIAKKGTQQALGGDSRYTAMFKLASALNKAGYPLDTIIVDSDDFATAITEVVGNTLPWLTAMQAGPSLGQNFGSAIASMNGLVGYFAGVVPIYVVGNANLTTALKGNIFGNNRQSSVIVGLHKDLTLVSELNKLEDLIEGLITARYDITHGSSASTSAGIGYVSGV